MKTITLIKKDKNLKGTIKLPASKSESNRLLIIHSLCKENFEIHNLSQASDTKSLQELLNKIRKQKISDNYLKLDVQDAGTVMRFLTAYLSIKSGKWLLTGSKRMTQRPIGTLVETLNKLGAKIKYVKNRNFPPLLIDGTNIKGGEIKINASESSQFISALLLIAPKLPDGLIIHLNGDIVSLPYIKMTIKIIEYFGIKIIKNNKSLIIKNQPYIVRDFNIESDWTAASYWFEMAAFADKVDLLLLGLKNESLQGDAVIVDIFKKFGIKSNFSKNGIHLTKNNHIVKNFKYDFTNFPDIAQTLSVTCAALNINAELYGLKNLQIKETDRLKALKNELLKIGADAEIIQNSKLKIQNSCLNLNIKDNIKTYYDHRMAMSFAPIAIESGEITIENPEVVKKSYPNFWEDLLSVGFEMKYN